MATFSSRRDHRGGCDAHVLHQISPGHAPVVPCPRSSCSRGENSLLPARAAPRILVYLPRSSSPTSRCRWGSTVKRRPGKCRMAAPIPPWNACGVDRADGVSTPPASASKRRWSEAGSQMSHLAPAALRPAVSHGDTSFLSGSVWKTRASAPVSPVDRRAAQQ